MKKRTHTGTKCLIGKEIGGFVEGDERRCPGGVRRSQDGPRVAGILHAVQYHPERGGTRRQVFQHLPAALHHYQ